MDPKAPLKSHAEILKAVQELRLGHPVALPTETVYGLAAPVDNPVAIESLFKIKNRPFFDPLIVHVNSIEQAKTCFADWNPIAEKLANTFWPGPLTMVMEKSPRISPTITSGLQNVGIRWPQHPLFNEVLTALGVPLAAPSANKFGRTSPTTFQHVMDEFKHDNLFVLDGGPCQVGIESTVLLIEKTTPKAHPHGHHSTPHFQLSVLRDGMISADEIDQALSTDLKSSQSKNWTWLEKHQVDPKSSPGHMKHHYMPNTPLVLIHENNSSNEDQIRNDLNKKFAELPDVVESVKMIKPKSGVQKLSWMVLPDDPNLAARELYAQLRRVSELHPDIILFQIKKEHSEKPWAPIMDRLTKASSLILK